MKTDRHKGADGTFFFRHYYGVLIVLLGCLSAGWYRYYFVPVHTRYQSKIIQRDHLVNEYHALVKTQKNEQSTILDHQPLTGADQIHMLLEELEENKLLLTSCTTQKNNDIQDQFQLSFTGSASQGCSFVKLVEAQGIALKKISLKHLNDDQWCYTMMIQLTTSKK